MALGDNRQSDESLGRTQTDSNTYQPKMQMTTANLPAGDYLLTFSFQFQTDSGETNEFQMRMVEDIAGPATVVYESGELREANPGNAAGDSQDTCIVAIKRTLAAGVHTFDLEFRRTGTVDLVTIEEARMTFFELDGTYQEASTDAHSNTTSTSYQLKVSLNTGAIPAGTYIVRFSCEYNNEDPTNGNNMGLRFRQRKDPAGVDTITNLLGADSGNPAELELNGFGAGENAGDPKLCAGWEVPCMVLDADTYQYELHFRAVGGAFDGVGIALARLTFWRMS